MPALRTRPSTAPTRRGAKVVAITSAAAVAAVGVTLSLAAWTDNEWLTSGFDGDDPAISTSAFEVEQYAYPSTGGSAGTFSQHETSDEANVVTFSVEALSPQVPSYGLVGLRTTAGSLGGALTLQAADDLLNAGTTTDAAAAALFAATEVTVWTWSEADSTPAFGCDASTSSQPGVTQIAAGALAAAAGSASQELAAEGGDVQYYCYQLLFDVPNGADPEGYMGVGLVPAWEFTAESD